MLHLLLTGCLPPILTDTGLVSFDSEADTALDSGDGSGDSDGGDSGDTAADTSDSDPPIDDRDADGYTESDGDCDDSDPDVYPGAPEAFDLKDNDCNGVAIERASDIAGALAVESPTPVWALAPWPGDDSGLLVAGMPGSNAVVVGPASELAEGAVSGGTTLTRTDGARFGFSVSFGVASGESVALLGDPGSASVGGAVYLVSADGLGGGVVAADDYPSLVDDSLLGRVGLAAEQVGQLFAVTSALAPATTVYLVDADAAVAGTVHDVSLGASVTAGSDYLGLGYALSGATVLDGGGANLLMGAPYASPGARRNVGALVAFAEEGLTGNTGDTWSAEDADLIITGDDPDDRLGGAIVGVGDVTDDGEADVLVATLGDDGDGARSWYLIAGGQGIGAGEVSLYASARVEGVQAVSVDELTGTVGDGLFIGATAVGDLDGDSFSDVIFGSPGSSPGRIGAVLAASLRAGGTVDLIDSPLLVEGLASGDAFGLALALIDGTGDGIPDGVVSATDGTGGWVYFFPGAF
jgi:hypothetical protein